VLLLKNITAVKQKISKNAQSHKFLVINKKCTTFLIAKAFKNNIKKSKKKRYKSFN